MQGESIYTEKDYEIWNIKQWKGKKHTWYAERRGNNGLKTEFKKLNQLEERMRQEKFLKIRKTLTKATQTR